MTNEISELLERFRRGAELVAAVTTGASNVELDFTPEGGWSVRQIVCHLGDAEMVGAGRFRQTIAEENPKISAYDQDAWAARLNYRERKISEALDTFRTVRAVNYDLLKGQPESSFARTAVHAERGPLTLADLLRIYAEHAEKHAQQIQRVRAKYRESRTKS
jgi:hypothetical protein